MTAVVPRDVCGEVFGLVTYEADPEGALRFGGATRALFGRTFERLASTADYAERFVHPEDRAAVVAAFACSAREQRYRVVREDGSVIHVRDQRAPCPSDPRRTLGLVTDVTSIHEAELAHRRALHESDDRFRAILDGIPIAFWLGDPRSGEVLYASPEIERIWGVDRDEFQRDPGLWRRAIHPEDRGRILALHEASPSQRETEHRIVRPDGQIRWVRVRIFPVVGPSASAPRAAGVAEDVTHEHDARSDMRRAEEEIRRRLEEKTVLLREIHHRVKNNLQIVSSLLYLQATAAGDAAVRGFCDQTRSRVLSMAYIHETLYQSGDLSGVNFAAYLRKLVSGLSATYAELAPQVAIATDVEDARLDLDAAIPCGLVVNELVTNALKYAFPAGRRGTVRISFRSADGRHALHVDDDGIGLPETVDTEAGTTLGLKLVRTLAEQLGACLEVESHGGTHYRISFGAVEEGAPDPERR